MLVEQCSCSSVHVTIGAVTLRLEGNALSSLAMTLQEAALALVGDRLKSAGPRAVARREAGDGGSACAHVDDEALS